MSAPLLLPAGGAACARVEKAFLSCIDDHAMAEPLRDGVLVAFSGGRDSVLLLSLMAAYAARHGIRLAAAHVHHGLRGAQAERDAAFCKRFAEERHIPFFLCRVDVPAYLNGEGSGCSVEEGARQLRYNALERLLDAHPYRCCVTAHHATDNIETVLLNLLRGSGARGMCGIPPVRGRILRPLLYAPRREVDAAVEELGLPFVEDETNQSECYDRNYIRANILPHLSHLRPDPEAAATRLCANLREESEPADRAAEAFFATHVQNGRAARQALVQLPRAVAFRVVVRLFAGCGAEVRPERTHLLSLLAVLGSRTASGRCPMPGGYVAVFDQSSVTFEEDREPIVSPYDIPLEMGKNVLGESGGILWLFSERNVEFEKSMANVYNLFTQAKLDSVTIGMLRARTRREGDAYRYGGMTRRVRRLMSGKHISPAMRAVWPVVYDERGILWVPGFGVREGEKAPGSLYAYYTYGEQGGTV